jgi:glutamate-1-semialdehyde 2,1-aminomutase
VPVVGPLLGITFVPAGDGAPTDYEGAVRAADTGVYARLFRAMLDRGVALAPGPYEVAFPSMAHTEADLDLAVAVAGEAIAEVTGG